MIYGTAGRSISVMCDANPGGGRYVEKKSEKKKRQWKG